MKPILLATALITGCAAPSTPQEMVERNPRVDYALTRAPQSAAACMARNINGSPDHAIYLVAVSQPGDADGTFEVIARVSGQLPILFAKVAPSGSGSRATVWMTPGRIDAGRDGLLPTAVKGC